jgi:type II secretory pathway component PulC
MNMGKDMMKTTNGSNRHGSRHGHRHGMILALAAALVLIATPVLGEEAPASRPDSHRAGTEAQLEEAQARLEAAAREIAELTARIVGEVGVSALARIEELARRPRPVMLGIAVGPVGEAEAQEDGVLVLGVTPGSSADESGIRSGDVLVSFGDTRLDWADGTSPVNKLLEGLREVEPGTEVTLAYRRNGDAHTASVEARPWSWAAALSREGERLREGMPPGAMRLHMRHFMADHWGDMELAALSPGLAEYFDTADGVLVVRAPSDTTLGLQDGDVIVDIAGRTPADPGHVVRILRSYAPGERLVMTVVRKGERQQLQADVPGAREGR